MDTNCSPYQLAIDLLDRSPCTNVRTASVIVDKKGRIFAWGWNHPGQVGLGLCAERHAILRANRKRLPGATIFVAGIRFRNRKYVFSKPCDKCETVMGACGIKKAEYITPSGDWKSVDFY